MPSYDLLQRFNITLSGVDKIYLSQPLDYLFAFRKLRYIISEQLGVNIDKVTLDAHLANDLGANEYDGPEILLAVEEEFNVEIPDDYIAKFTGLSLYLSYTTKDIFDYIVSLKKLKVKDSNFCHSTNSFSSLTQARSDFSKAISPIFLLCPINPLVSITGT